MFVLLKVPGHPPTLPSSTTRRSSKPAPCRARCAPERTFRTPRAPPAEGRAWLRSPPRRAARGAISVGGGGGLPQQRARRSEEHTSELQSRQYLVCRLLLEKKKPHILF